MAGRTQPCRTHKTSTWNLIKLIKMRNYELIKEIYEIAIARKGYIGDEYIIDLIVKNRPEIAAEYSESSSKELD